ncbi:protein JASON-like isoform X1 [Apium graveolens]|uniref:protein JASON-like isoform X1 n=1 Tax=Apium graveolens TaxID=4045 RepID=UPI003D7A741C
MICSWPEFISFFYRSTMGCLFGCFQLRDDRRRPSSHLVSQSQPSIFTEPVLNRSRKRLGVLLQENDGLEERADNKKCDVETGQDFDVEGLRDEAKFLKACGTLPETPAEIRKSKQSPPNQNSDHSKFHSWLPDASFQKLNLDMQCNQSPTPVNRYDGWLTGSDSLDCTPSSSCITRGQNPMRNSASTSDATDTATSGTGIQVHGNQTTIDQHRNKPMQFHCQSDESSILSKGYSEVSCESSKRSELVGTESLSRSPYPTPLQLNDDMQTPGTVFPSYIGDMGNGKNPRIRSQYVHSLLNPVENSSQWNMLKEEDSESSQLSSSLTELQEQSDKTTYSEVGMVQESVQKDAEVEESLSSWLKPVNKNGNNQRTVSFASEKVYYGKNLGDRPIIGMVAAHWTEEEPSPVEPKWWDGNGIPNSTTKYKEDQKVSWHATPFEERLEKALSEESSITQRKTLSGTPVKFNDKECDTAISQIKSSTHFNSVVSC